MLDSLSILWQTHILFLYGVPKNIFNFWGERRHKSPSPISGVVWSCDLVAERECKKQVYYIHSSTAAIKNIPTILIVSITKLITLSSITIQILQLNNLVFQIRCKITATNSQNMGVSEKNIKKNAFFFLSCELLLHFVHGLFDFRFAWLTTRSGIFEKGCALSFSAI